MKRKLKAIALCVFAHITNVNYYYYRSDALVAVLFHNNKCLLCHWYKYIHGNRMKWLQVWVCKLNHHLLCRLSAHCEYAPHTCTINKQKCIRCCMNRNCDEFYQPATRTLFVRSLCPLMGGAEGATCAPDAHTNINKCMQMASAPYVPHHWWRYTISFIFVFHRARHSTTHSRWADGWMDGWMGHHSQCTSAAASAHTILRFR